jgi:hypothetical protein
MPPPWLHPKPYAHAGSHPGPEADAFGWQVTEHEEEQQLAPGLETLAREALRELIRLGQGQHTPHISRNKLLNNPHWPDELAARAGKLAHERYVLLLPAALARTQDDKGRVRWTLFGGSEQGPGKAFWRGFFTAPGVEGPREEAVSFFAELLSGCYGVPVSAARDLPQAGLRILPAGSDPQFPHDDEGPLPSWAERLLLGEDDSLEGVRFLLTFRPFARLPAAVKSAYLEGRLHLLPFPGSLLFWGVPGYRRLSKQLPFAQQVPLLQLYGRHNELGGLRIPQAGWLHEKVPVPEAGTGPYRPLFVRTHRWQKTLRSEDELASQAREDNVTRVLFSTAPDDIALYNKPMARNVQIWSRSFSLVLDGPRHGPRRIVAAHRKLDVGGTFGYRFQYPAMRVGVWEVYWHRPVCAFGGEHADPEGVQPKLLLSAPTGYLTAYRADEPDLDEPVELWPRFLDRPMHHAAVELFKQETSPRRWHTATNVRSLLEWNHLLGGPLPRSLARSLLSLPHGQTLDAWLDSLPQRANDPIAGGDLAEGLRELLREDTAADTGPDLTFDATATRAFEESYWRTIAVLAHGKYRNKSNADCIRDEPTRAALEKVRSDLYALAKHLVKQHSEAIARSGVEGAWVGEHRFTWRTDFDFNWMGGWVRNQKEAGVERNILVRIPGRDAGQAVIMADHYDTAYMHDCYYLAEGGTGARVAAAGADDNHSATALLLLAAPILLEMSKAGRLGCDVWLVHLTGEEFPSDCLGARHLASDLVQGTLRVEEPDGPVHDLSKVRVRGVHVSDMIAHNNDRNRFVYQMAPGEGPASARLAAVAHGANLAWNARAAAGNREKPRRGAKAFRRSEDPETVPDLAPYAILQGEVRPNWDPRSTLFNTDGQIFSDVGVPVVLFMEDYDINRKGYHDTHDTMGNIDLDYGAALAAVVLETVARAAQ